MKNKKLKLYLYFCAAIFFVLLAVVLFYSFGYRYNVKEKEAIRTGAIIIKSIPENVAVYVNDDLFENNSALNNLLTNYVKIGNLNSGIYNIKIKKDDYFDWEKNVNVNGGYITELKNIILLKNDYEKTVLLNDIETGRNINNIWISNGKNKIAYRNKNRLILFDLNLRTKEGAAEMIVDFNNASFKKTMGNGIDFEISDITWSNDDTKIIAKISQNNNLFWYLINSANNKVYDISFIFSEISEVRNKYNFAFDKSLFYLKNNFLYEFNYEKSVSKRILNDISGFLVHGDYLYYFKKGDSALYLNNLADLNNLDNSAAAKIISTMPAGFDTQSPARIIKSSDNAYIVLSWSGELYFISKMNEVIFINSQVKNAYFANYNERIVYYNDHEIWIYYLKEKLSQPPKKEFNNELITRYSEKISNVSLHSDEEHLFYKEGDTFKFAELDNRDKVNIFDVLELAGNDIFYSRDNNAIYYVEDNKFVKMRLDEK